MVIRLLITLSLGSSCGERGLSQRFVIVTQATGTAFIRPANLMFLVGLKWGNFSSLCVCVCNEGSVMKSKNNKI